MTIFFVIQVKARLSERTLVENGMVVMHMEVSISLKH